MQRLVTLLLLLPLVGAQEAPAPAPAPAPPASSGPAVSSLAPFELATLCIGDPAASDWVLLGPSSAVRANTCFLPWKAGDHATGVVDIDWLPDLACGSLSALQLQARKRPKELDIRVPAHDPAQGEIKGRALRIDVRRQRYASNGQELRELGWINWREVQTSPLPLDRAVVSVGFDDLITRPSSRIEVRLSIVEAGSQKVLLTRTVEIAWPMAC